MSQNFLSVSEAAEYLNVSDDLLRRLIADGSIATINVATRRLVPIAEIERISRDGIGTPRASRKIKPSTAMAT